MSITRSKNGSKIIVPGLLFGISVLAFGFFIFRLGYYWDDWSQLLVNRLYGWEGYRMYYAEDRPLSGWTQLLLNPLLGYSPANWQILVFFLRGTTAWLFFLLLSELGFTTLLANAFAAALFLVYPLFTLHPLAVTFHHHWVQYGLTFLSFLALIWSIKHPKYYLPFTLLSLACAAAQMTITEYFMPLEALKLLLIWVFIPATGKIITRLVRTIKYFLPYLVLIILYLSYRLFLIKLPGEDPYRPEILFSLFSAPLTALNYLAKLAALETYQILLGSWQNVLDNGLSSIPRSLLIPDVVQNSWIAAAAALLLVLAAFAKIKKQDEASFSADNRPTPWTMIAIGLAAVWLGAAPAWLSGRQILDDFHSNRYGLAALFGACILWAVILERTIRSRTALAVVYAGLIALSVGFQYRVGADFAEIWKSQTDLYWQLSWRAPHIQNGTALIFETEVFPNQGLFSTSSAINFLYPQPPNPERLAYWAYTMRPEMAEKFQGGELVTLHTQFRSLQFDGALPDSLLIHYDPGRSNCAWVLNQADALNPDIPGYIREALAASNMQRIAGQPLSGSYPPAEIIGAEPQRDFCYLYQKAALAAQLENWAEVTAYADRILAAGNYPDDPWFKTPHEWLVFMRGYMMSGDFEKAGELILAASTINPARYQEYLCDFWHGNTLDGRSALNDRGTIADVSRQLGCAVP